MAVIGLAALAVGVLAVAMIVWAFTLWPLAEIRQADVESFAAAHDLAITQANGRFVVGYLVRSLRWRRWGGVVGLVAGFVSTQFTSAGLVIVSTTWFFSAVAGYFVGTLAAEFRNDVPISKEPQQVVTASLVARRRRDYLTPEAIITGYGVGAVAIGMLIAGELWPHRAPRSGLLERALLVVAIVIVVVAVDVWTRRVVQRPLTVAAPDVTAAHHAVRANAVHRLAGAGVAFAAWLLSWLFLLSLGHDVQTRGSDQLVSGLGLIAFVLSIRSWRRLRRQPWVVRQQVDASRG
jgi:hypothetical protein